MRTTPCSVTTRTYDGKPRCPTTREWRCGCTWVMAWVRRAHHREHHGVQGALTEGSSVNTRRTVRLREA